MATIYALCDPRLRRGFKYVGFMHHRMKPGQYAEPPPSILRSEEVKIWVHALRAENLEPKLVVLEADANFKQAARRKFHWVAVLQREGFDILNRLPAKFVINADELEEVARLYHGSFGV
jgi:hypothetical protein